MSRCLTPFYSCEMPIHSDTDETKLLGSRWEVSIARMNQRDSQLPEAGIYGTFLGLLHQVWYIAIKELHPVCSASERDGLNITYVFPDMSHYFPSSIFLYRDYRTSSQQPHCHHLHYLMPPAQTSPLQGPLMATSIYVTSSVWSPGSNQEIAVDLPSQDH
jgi:hypothetical protein